MTKLKQLTNLNVKKVSFVRRAANKRSFLLLKSADADEANETNEIDEIDEMNEMNEVNKTDKINKNENQKEKVTMTETIEELKKQLIETEEEKANLAKQLAQLEAEKKSVEEALTSKVEELTKHVNAQREYMEKAELMKWFEQKAYNYPEEAEKVVNDIYELRKANPELAAKLMEKIESVSNALGSSQMFKSVGKSDIPEVDAFTKLEKEEDILKALREKGDQWYEKYREEVLRRR